MEHGAATSSAEADRARRAYAERDAAPPSVYTWDNPAQVWHKHEAEWQLLAALRRHGASFSGATVLEVGSGFGEVLDRMRQFGATGAVGVELSPGRVAAARERHPRIEVQEGDAARLPFPDGAFDIVTQFVCLSSIIDPAVRRAALAEMWRVTRPGGLVVSYDLRPTPRAVQAAGRAYARLRGLDAAAADAGTPVRPLGPGELLEAFPGAQLRTVTLNFELAALAGRSRALARALQAVPALRTHLLAVARRP